MFVRLWSRDGAQKQLDRDKASLLFLHSNVIVVPATGAVTEELVDQVYMGTQH